MNGDRNKMDEPTIGLKAGSECLDTSGEYFASMMSPVKVLPKSLLLSMTKVLLKFSWFSNQTASHLNVSNFHLKVWGLCPGGGRAYICAEAQSNAILFHGWGYEL